MWRTDSLEKTLMLGKDWRQEKGMTEDEIIGWHHQLDGYEFEQAPGVGDGLGGLVYCSPLGFKESNINECLNWTELNSILLYVVAQSCLTLCNPMDCSKPGFPVPEHLLEFAQVPVHAWVMPSVTLWHPLLLLPSIFPSIRDFSNDLVVCIRWPKYWSFSFSMSPFNEYSGLISYKIGWLISLLAGGLLGDFSNTTVQRHQFFGAVTSLQSNSRNPTWPLWRPQLDSMDVCWQSVACAFQHTARFLIAFLPRRNHLLISWLQLPFTVLLGLKKRKSAPASNFSPSICHEVKE